MMVGETMEGIARYPINLLYVQIYRDSPKVLRNRSILTPIKQQTTLADIANVAVVSGPSMLKTEDARPTSWINIDVRDHNMVSMVNDLKKAIAINVQLKAEIHVRFLGGSGCMNAPALSSN